jgi:type I restriction enzyme S subunit
MTSNLRFGDCAELRNEKVNPENEPDSYYIGLEHIEQQSLALSGHGYGSDVDSQKQRFYKGDILFGKLRPYFRKVVIAPFDGICSTDIWVVTPKGDTDRDFLYYWMASENFIAKSTIASEGSRMPRANWQWVSDFELGFQDLNHQQVVGKALRVLDEKIETNKQLSKTLEDIAQTIFKSWFIDFDPVKAKMAGEKPVGMDAATAALFPDSMEDSELGLIPKGWAWGTVGDIADVIDCLHSKKPVLLEVGLPYLQLDTISDDGVLKFDKAGKISEEDYKKWTARIEVVDGDCLITNVGRVGAVSQVPNHFKAAIGRNITAMRPKRIKMHKTFLISALTSEFMAKEITRNTDSGTILEALNVRSIPKLIILMPSDELLGVFEMKCGPMWLQVHELYRQNVQLANLRDSLLPRLISGELQIPEEMLAS